MAKTEEQIMLERLGIMESTQTSDSDFEQDSPEVDEDFLAERERLEEWEFQLSRREREANLQERDIARERERLMEIERDLAEREERLEALLEKHKAVIDKAEYVLDDDVMDEYRQKKKAEKLKKAREEATNSNNFVWNVSGWNTNE